MGTWQEVSDIARRFGAQQLNDTAWLFQLPGIEEDRQQKVFVFYELMQPDFEFIQIKSAFAPIQQVDAEQVIRELGQMQIGAIGFTPTSANDSGKPDGWLSITTSIPLKSFDVSDPASFMLYLHILARAADNCSLRVPSLAAGDAPARHAPPVAASPAPPANHVPSQQAPGQGEPAQDDEEWVRHLAEEYGRACAVVMESLEATFDVAKQADGARKMANTRPQHEISIQTFTAHAEQKEREFGPLCQKFENARAHAKEIGNKLVGACHQQDPELMLLMTLDPQIYSRAGAAIEYMRTIRGATPHAFLESAGEGTAAVNSSPDFGEPGFRGVIYYDAVQGELNQL